MTRKHCKKKWNKKGSMEDIIYIAVIGFAAAVVLLMIYVAVSKTNDHVQSNSMLDTPSKTFVSTIKGYFTSILDKVGIFILVMSLIISLVLASMIRVHPAFAFVGLIFMVISVVVAAMMSNAYEAMTSNPKIASAASDLTFTTFTMRYLPYIVGIFDAIMIGVMLKLGDNQ